MHSLSDISNNHHSWWSRPIGVTALITALGICLALIVLAFTSSNAASERNNDMKSTSSSQQSTTHVQVESATPQIDTPQPASQDSSSGARTSTNSMSDSSKSSVQVTVNGETVPVPENGSVHRTLQSADGQTTLDVSTSSDGGASNSSSSSLNVNVSSNSSSFSSNSSVTIGGTTENN